MSSHPQPRPLTCLNNTSDSHAADNYPQLHFAPPHGQMLILLSLRAVAGPLTSLPTRKKKKTLPADRAPLLHLVSGSRTAGPVRGCGKLVLIIADEAAPLISKDLRLVLSDISRFYPISSGGEAQQQGRGFWCPIHLCAAHY